MLKLRLTALLATILIVAAGLKAQVTSEPSPLYDNSQDVVIYFHANEGNKGLANQAESVAIYAHTGVITNASKNESDWKYSTDWDKNLEKYKMTYVSPNLYSLNIGNVKDFYGIKSDTEVVEKLVFVFRNASGSKTGKAKDGSDITLDVISTAFQIDFSKSIEGTTVTTASPSVDFSLTSNQKADRMWISINLETVAEQTDTDHLDFTYTFTQKGRYNIYGNVEKEGKVTSRSYMLTFVEAAEMKDYPGGVPRMGAVRGDDGKVTFCLAAPMKESVTLMGSWFDFDPEKAPAMYAQDYEGQRYFWTTVEGLDADKPYLYYYLVDDYYRVGDPYARLVLDPNNDKYIPASVYPDMPEYPSQVTGNVPLAVYQENLNDYAWTDQDFKPVAKKDLVIYELLFRDFTGTEGKAQGNGTVRQAIEKLPYLKSLGVNAIELLPINEFNGNNSWGYNPNFYFAPDKAYGTPDDYKEFINLCHENGIAVILDMVFNQTDWLHPWYQMYPAGQNPMYNADAPHAYSVLNDWNQGYPLVQQQWRDMLQFWLSEYKVDGFRFDLVKGLGDNTSYANDSGNATNAYNASRVARMKALHDAMREVNPDAYFINENLAGAKEENEMAEDGELNWANVNNSGCQFAMGWNSNSSLNRMWALRDSRTAGSTVAYLESHDEERLAYKQNKWGATGVKGNLKVSCQRLGSAAAQMILVPGSHMIWQFSEMGNAQSTKQADGGSNNTSPKIVNWALLDNPDNAALVKCYSEMIGIRLGHPDLFTDNGDYTMNLGTWSTGRYIATTSGSKELYVVINPNIEAGKNVTVTINFLTDKNANYHVASKSFDSNPSFDAAAKTVTVEPNCYAVISTKDVSGIDDVVFEATEGTRIFAVPGGVRVVNCEGAVEVYSLDGIAVATAAGDATIDVEPGTYVVRAAGKTAKVQVR